MRSWPAVWAVLAAFVTGALVVGAGGGGWLRYLALGYIGIVVLALFVPAAVTAQVVGGQVLAGVVLVGGAAGGLFTTALVVAGVVVTAELLAVVARLDSPVRRRPEGVLARTGTAGALAGGVFGVVVFSSGQYAVGGLIAVAVASAVCFGVAMRMVGGARKA